MGDLMLQLQTQSEKKVLEYKLDTIRTHIETRLPLVDPILQAEFQTILNIISKYDRISSDWHLSRPLVNVPDDFLEGC